MIRVVQILFLPGVCPHRDMQNIVLFVFCGGAQKKKIKLKHVCELLRVYALPNNFFFVIKPLYVFVCVKKKIIIGPSEIKIITFSMCVTVHLV